MNYEEEINKLKEEIKKLSSSTTIPFDVGEAFRKRIAGFLPEKLKHAPQAAITEPTGGSTNDQQARTAIVSIITALEVLGLISEN